MNRRLLLILICALIGGASASYLVYRLVGNRSAAPAPALAQIVVAAKDLQIGTLLGPADIRMGAWAGTLPKGAITKLDTALNRGAIANIYQNEPVLADRLAAVGSGGGLAAIITPGMRASAVRVDDVVGLAGFVTPGMRVDVVISGIPPGGSMGDGPHATTLLQNIQVLSAGENLQKDGEGKARPVQVVNLLVTPQQAEKLTLASSQTRIQLVLRNPLDMQTATTAGARMTELFGVAPRPAEPLPVAKARITRAELGPPRPVPPAPPAPALEAAVAPKIRVIEVFNGTTRTEVKFTIQENPK